MRDLKITTGVAAALLAAGCGQNGDADNGWTASNDTAVCVDQQGHRVPDDRCPQQRYASGGGGGAGNAFLWYYLGRNAALPYYGGTVRGGSYAPIAGHSYTRAPAFTTVSRSGSIVRGGFGSSAHGFGGAGE